MNIGFKNFLCCSAAACMLLASLAGCSANNGSNDNKTDNEKKEEATVTTSDTTSDPDSSKDPVPTISTTPAPSTPVEIPKEGSVEDIDYKIETATSGASSDDRGYYVFSTNDEEYPVCVLIAAGEFSTGGHDIGISNLEYDGSELIITVSETAPEPGDIVTEAFTYPCCGIELSKLPQSVKVLDKAGREFDCLYVYIKESEIEPGWIAVIEDGAGEIMYKTYVYETADGKYSYINVVSTTASYGSPVWNDVVKGSGFADTREDIVEKAKDFGSCGFVLKAGDTRTVYTVDEFLAAKAF